MWARRYLSADAIRPTARIHFPSRLLVNRPNYTPCVRIAVEPAASHLRFGIYDLISVFVSCGVTALLR